jgi:hypothetical protein
MKVVSLPIQVPTYLSDISVGVFSEDLLHEKNRNRVVIRIKIKKGYVFSYYLFINWKYMYNTNTNIIVI